MHVVFVDDSKQVGPRQGLGQIISLGAVAFDESELKPFADAFWAIYDRHRVPHDVELKWARDKASWWAKDNRDQLLTPIRSAVLQSAAAHSGIVVVVVWDLNRTGFQGETPERLVLKFLYERVAMMLQNRRVRGMFVFDEPGGGRRDQDAWLADSIAFTDSGTEYVTGDGLVLPMVTAASHHHPHLQLADLIVGSVAGALVGNPFGQALIPLIKPLFLTNAQGLVGGTGLKLFPDTINNLNHWVLGETSFYRASGRIALPWRSSFWKWPSDDGLGAA